MNIMTVQKAASHCRRLSQDSIQVVIKLQTFDIRGKYGLHFAQDGILIFANLTFFYC